MTTDTPQRNEVWSRYWAHGATHSCAGSFGEQYEGALADFWQRCFASLANGSRVLDLCTGNGPIVRLLMRQTQGSTVRCDAIDWADVAPTWVAQMDQADRDRVHFKGGIRAEQLPFPDQSFDLVVSQYGIEYCDTQRVASEIRRVLRPDGHIALVLHHADSRPVALAAVELDHLSWLEQGEGLLDCCEHMMEPMHRARTAEGRAALNQDADALQWRARFNTVQAERSALIERSPCPDVLHECQEGVAHVLGLAAQRDVVTAGEALSSLRQQLKDSRLRLQELRDHALSEPQVQALAQQLCPEGHECHVSTLDERGALMGWTLIVSPT